MALFLYPRSDIWYFQRIHIFSVLIFPKMLLRPFRLIFLLLIMLRIEAGAQEIGLQLYSLRDQFANDVPSTMAKVREMGIREVEMYGTYGLPFPQFIKLLAQNGLSVISFGTSFEKLQTSPQEVADEARSYGARFVVVYWLPHDANFTKDDAEKAVEVLNRAGKVIAQNGLLLCYHPHGYEFSPFEGGTMFDYMVKNMDPRFVYLQMDVFWVKQAGQEPVALLRKYPTRFVMLHLKDRKPGTRNSRDGKADVESNVALGTGDVGITEIMLTARELGIQHYFIEDESSRAETQIPQSLAFLKSLNDHTRK
jgi:sugar phosphate isomerase/epimerase